MCWQLLVGCSAPAEKSLNSPFYGPPESKQTKRQSGLKVGLQPCGNKRLCFTGSGWERWSHSKFSLCASCFTFDSRVSSSLHLSFRVRRPKRGSGAKSAALTIPVSPLRIVSRCFSSFSSSFTVVSQTNNIVGVHTVSATVEQAF